MACERKTRSCKHQTVHCARSVLTNSIVGHIVRRLVKPFPRLAETIEVEAYYCVRWLNRKDHRNPQKDLSPKPVVDQHFSQEPQLLVDISTLVRYNFHTGVPRVVRSILRELLMHPPAGYRVEAVYISPMGDLFYARQFAHNLLNQDGHGLPDSLVDVHNGDIFYTADVFYSYPFNVLATLSARGVRMFFTVHDLIPLIHPDLVTKYLRLAHTDWFQNVLRVANGIICPSRAVADEVGVWIRDHPPEHGNAMPIWSVHLGADIPISNSERKMSADETRIVDAVHQRPTVLMVGTVEPRKRQAQVLKAVESLWTDDLNINLVMVGGAGWQSQAIDRYINRHVENKKRLFWIKNASDSLLLDLYAQSTVLIAASVTEGFGLPLIEAAHHGLPIIARDIPVFREVAGNCAYYFDGDDPESVAEAIRAWFSLHREGHTPSSVTMSWLTWRQSAEYLLDLVIPGHYMETPRGTR